MFPSVIVNNLGGMGDIFVEMAQVYKPPDNKKLLKNCDCKSWYNNNEDRLKQMLGPDFKKNEIDIRKHVGYENKEACKIMN